MRVLRNALMMLIGLVASVVLVATPAGADSYTTPDSGINVDTGSSGGSSKPGDTIDVEVTDAQPGSTLDVYVQSDPVFLGTMTADSTGTARGSFTLPAGLEAGDHTVVVNGTDSSGNPRTWSYGITVADASESNGNGSGSAPDELSFTGSTTVPLVGAGALLVAAGVATVRFRQRRLGVSA